MSPSRTSRGFRQILCPVDFSKHSRTALRHAAALADRSGCPLTALVVNDPMLEAATAAATRNGFHLTDTTTTELRRFVTRTLGPTGASVKLTVVVGHPPEQIDRVARRLGADLVVMGTHGLSGFKKWFFGSTTEATLRNTNVPVLAVPARTRASSGDLESFPGATVLAPIDLDGSERADIRRASAAAQRLGSTLLPMHVLLPAQLPPWIEVDVPTVERQRLKDVEKRLSEAVNAAGTAAFLVVVGDPVEQIVAEAARRRIDLIVLNLKRHGPWGPRRGSVTYRVLCSGAAAVLALPVPRR